MNLCVPPPPAGPPRASKRAREPGWDFARRLVQGMNVLAGVSLAAIMGLTCLDVLLRVLFRRPIRGTLDVIEILGALTLALGLPYTTAVKGHVAVEYFFQRLPRRARIAVDSLERAAGVFLFTALAYGSFWFGASLRRSGQVTPTLQLPLYPLPWAIGFSCLLVAVVILYNLLHPGREMIKP